MLIVSSSSKVNFIFSRICETSPAMFVNSTAKEKQQQKESKKSSPVGNPIEGILVRNKWEKLLQNRRETVYPHFYYFLIVKIPYAGLKMTIKPFWMLPKGEK